MFAFAAYIAAKVDVQKNHCSLGCNEIFIIIFKTIWFHFMQDFYS